MKRAVRNAAIEEVGEPIGLVTSMRDGEGLLDRRTCRLEPIVDPFEPKALRMPAAQAVVRARPWERWRGRHYGSTNLLRR